MADTTTTGDDLAEVVPLPATPATPADPAAGPVEQAEVLTGEVLTEEEFQQRTRGRRFAALPALMHDPAARREAGHDLAVRAASAPLAYPGAVLRGATLVGRSWYRWVWHLEVKEAVRKADAMHSQWQQIGAVVAFRWKVTGVSSIPVAVTSGLFGFGVLDVPTPAWWATGGITSAVLALLGRRKDGAPGRKAVLPGGRSLAWAMSGDHLVEAFRAAGLIGKADLLALVERPHRDGPGWAVVIDLPPGRLASQVMAKREALASALAVDEQQVVAERVRGKGGHAGRVALWVADTDPLVGKDLTSYLEELPELSLWDGLTIGQTARGRQVVVTLLWTAWLIAGLPRYGKSNLLRLFLVAAALDAMARIYACDLKDGADLNPLRPVAHRLLIASAEGEETEATLRALLAMIVEIETEVLDRYRRFKEMPEVDVPEGKITRALYSDPAADMPMLVLAIDECQLAFEELASDTKVVKELRRLIVDKTSWLVRKGPAAGCVVILATQKPDRDSIPTRLRDNIGSRAALRLPTQQSNDMALGTGKYTDGVDATRFTSAHRGAAWLLADDLSGVGAAEGVIIRASKLDLGPARKAAEVGRARRLALGMLTGDAAGDTGPAPAELPDGPTDPVPPLLRRVADYVADDDRRIVPTAELLAELQLDLDATEFGLKMRAADCPAARSSTVRGYRPDDVRAAVERHETGTVTELAEVS